MGSSRQIGPISTEQQQQRQAAPLGTFPRPATISDAARGIPLLRQADVNTFLSRPCCSCDATRGQQFPINESLLKKKKKLFPGTVSPGPGGKQKQGYKIGGKGKSCWRPIGFHDEKVKVLNFPSESEANPRKSTALTIRTFWENSAYINSNNVFHGIFCSCPRLGIQLILLPPKTIRPERDVSARQSCSWL